MLGKQTCRNCKKRYDPNKSRADYKGYCGQKCLHAKARELGYSSLTYEFAKKCRSEFAAQMTEYGVLKKHGEVGYYPEEMQNG